jgi:hypothetical protein
VTRLPAQTYIDTSACFRITYTKDPADSEFVTLFGTHGPKAGQFDQEMFHKLFQSAADIQKAAQEAKANDAGAVSLSLHIVYWNSYAVCESLCAVGLCGSCARDDVM